MIRHQAWERLPYRFWTSAWCTTSAK